MARERLLDVGSHLTIAITFVLFVVALFVKGLGHDILLEAGVFLVSVKLIIMASRNSVAAEEVRRELREIRQLLAELPRHHE